MIVAFVGIDGTGKTTLLSRFERYLKSVGKDTQIIKALDPASIFMQNYNRLRSEFFSKYPNKKHEFNIIGSHIMSFDLLQQSEAIKKMDATNTVILLDRWSICQQLYAKVWMAENHFSSTAYSMCLEPHLTFVLDSDINIIQQRLQCRGGSNEYENILSLRRLKKLYIQYAAENKNAILIENNQKIYKPYINIIREYRKKDTGDVQAITQRGNL